MQPAASKLQADEALPALLDEGTQVGEAARTYVPGGVLIELPYNADAERIAERKDIQPVLGHEPPRPRVFTRGLPCHSEYPAARATLADLLGDPEALIRQLRADLATTMGKHNDAGTSDFLTASWKNMKKWPGCSAPSPADIISRLVPRAGGWRGRSTVRGTA